MADALPIITLAIARRAAALRAEAARRVANGIGELPGEYGGPKEMLFLADNLGLLITDISEVSKGWEVSEPTQFDKDAAVTQAQESLEAAIFRQQYAAALKQQREDPQ